MIRTGNAGYTLGTAWSEFLSNSQSLRLYRTTRTAARFGELPVAFDPDILTQQTDLNVSEGNPRSGYFYIQTDAACYTRSKNSFEVFQGGEEGQDVLSILLDSFVSAAACVDTANVSAKVSFPGFIPIQGTSNRNLNVTNAGAATTTANELQTCTSASGLTDVTGCVDVTSTATFDTTDPDNWALVCFDYDVPQDLDPQGVAESALVGKKCEQPGGACCVVGGAGANACLTTCPGGNCNGPGTSP